MLVKSIRGRIQLWHTALLAILMAGLLTAFYFHEKEIREREFDHELIAPLSSAIPHFGADANRQDAPGQRHLNTQYNNSVPSPRPDSGPMREQGPMHGPGAMEGSDSTYPPRPPMRGPRAMEGGDTTYPRRPPPMRGPGSMEGSNSMPPPRPYNRGPENMRTPEEGMQPPPSDNRPPEFDNPTDASIPHTAPPMPLSLTERQANEVGSIMEAGFYIASVTSDGSLVHSSPNVRENISYPTEMIEAGRQSTFMRTENGYREAIHRGPPPSYNIVLIGASTDAMYAELATLRWQLIGTGICIVAFGYVIGWILVGRSLKPIHSISEAAAQISAGNLSQRIDLNDTESELGQMGEVLNDTFIKLDSAFEQQVRFTADASHELRTPISVILAKCQFALMREREPEKYVAALKTCEASAQHIRGLVESLLELARVDSGEFKISKRPADLSETAGHTVDMLNTLAEAKNIRLTLKHDSVPAQFDPDRIHQVATNLIGNAIKYTQDGGTIDVHVHGKGSFAVMEVRDTGPGIEPKHIPHLFDRFYRSSDERSDDRRSTGLGLAITKAIVDAHRGKIIVESELGQGSCFTVQLPAET